MSNRILELLNAYRRRPEEREEESLVEFVAREDPYVFSHHPPTPAFREHVWKIGGLYWCKGCVMTFCGVVFGLAFYFLTGWLGYITDLEAGGIFVLLLAPTLVVHALRLPRGCRHISRFLLGFLMASAFILLFLTDSWLVRGVIVAAYFGVRIPLERKRNRENR